MISEIFYRNGGVDPFPIPESEDFIHVHGKDPVALYSPFCSSEASGYYYWKSKDREACRKCLAPSQSVMEFPWALKE